MPLSDVNAISVNYSPSGASSNTFSDAVNADGSAKSITISSDTISYLYLLSAYECQKLSNSTYCQILSNLCVLKLYDTSSRICLLYQNIYLAAISNVGR